MASEPAEPTTRQDPRTRDAVLARVIEEANEQVDDDWTTADTLAFREYFGERLATRLADLGLLADPAQTTEVDAAADPTLPVDPGERALAWCRQWMATRETVHKRTAERDLLSLLLRGMARKLVAYRKWMSGDDVPVVHRLRREAEERQDRLDALDRWCDEKEADTRRWAEKHNPECECEVAPTTLDLIAEVRAALVGDQPPDSTTLECPHCRSLIRAASGVITQLDVDTHLAVCGPARQFARECATAALSGVALRDVEEADDAAGDLP